MSTNVIYNKKLPDNSLATAFENYTVTLMIGGEPYTLGLFDTQPQEEFDWLRTLIYPLTNVFLVCFSVVKPASFKHIKEKWVPEILHHCPHTPILLVGTQVDLRDNINILDKLSKNKLKPICFGQGEKLAKDK